jgi:GDP-D-mannose dehydratase
MQETLYLGNLSAKRDWGHAKEEIEFTLEAFEERLKGILNEIVSVE